MRFVHNYLIFFNYYYFYANTYFPSSRFVASLTLGERSLGSIDQEASSRREIRRNMSGGGRGF